MAFDDDLVEVLSLGLVERLQREIVDDQKVAPEQLSQFQRIGLIEARGLEFLEHLIGTHRKYPVLASHRDVSERPMRRDRGSARSDRSRNAGPRTRRRNEQPERPFNWRGAVDPRCCFQTRVEAGVDELVWQGSSRLLGDAGTL